MRNGVSFTVLSVVLIAWTSLTFAEGPTFTDITADAGVKFSHTFGDQKLSSILEATGPGCAVLDYDGDGFMDIYLVNGAHIEGISDPYPEGEAPEALPANRLYRNTGNGGFVDVTQKTGTGNSGYGIGAVVGDYDNDGDPDIFLANYGPNVLYRNNGDGSFANVAAEAGVVGPEKIKGFPKWSVHACFVDYDNDGLLDLYVGNYLAFDPDYKYFFGPEGLPGPLSYQGQPDILYRNEGDGTFADMTKAAGVFQANGRAMSVSAADFDNDGDRDIFVSNDAMENYLFRNDGDGTFKEVALATGVSFGEFGEATSSMAPAFDDFDNDGDLDLFVPDMGFSALYRNQDSLFEDISARSGIAEASGQYTSWAPVIFDIDNDGLQDLFVTNGDAHHLYAEEDLLLKNLGNLKFKDISLDAGPYFSKSEYVGRGAAAADWDNDGDMDLLVANLGGPTVVLRNDGGNGNHWLKLQLEGVESPRSGIGARVVLIAGEHKWTRESGASAGYLSSNDSRLHFGLGDQTSIDRIEVHWPSGATQVLTDVDVDSLVSIREESSPVEPEKPADDPPQEGAADTGEASR